MRSLLKNASSTEAGKLAPVPRMMASNGLTLIKQVDDNHKFGKPTVFPSVHRII